MKVSRVLTIATLLFSATLVSCSSDDDGGGGGGLGGSGNPGDTEPADMNGITAAHNAARAAVTPPASSPIPPLAWSGALAKVAQDYANKCIWGHSKNQYGENLYASTNSSAPKQVVDSWVSEVADYNYGSNSCSKVCGHYTQVVWAKSARVGCAKKTCTTGSPFGGGSWENWVCNYDPPGNFSGQKPY